VLFPFGRKAKLQKLLKELQIDIAAEGVKIGGGIKEDLERFGGQGNEALLTMEALVFLVYALGRHSTYYSDDFVRTIYYPTVLDISRLFGRMIGAFKPELATQSEETWLTHLHIRAHEFDKASNFHGENGEDKNSVYWLAASAISFSVGECENRLGEYDNRFFEMMIRTRLMKAILTLKFADRVQAMHELLYGHANPKSDANAHSQVIAG
jgi:hypothetical protein